MPAGYHAGRGTTSVALLDNDGDAALVSNLMQRARFPGNTRSADRSEFAVKLVSAQGFQTGARTPTVTCSQPSSFPLLDLQLPFDPVPPRVWLASGSPLASGGDRVELAGPAALPKNEADEVIARLTTATRPRPILTLTAPPRYWIVMEGLRVDLGDSLRCVAVDILGRGTRIRELGAGVAHR